MKKYKMKNIHSLLEKEMKRVLFQNLTVHIKTAIQNFTIRFSEDCLSYFLATKDLERYSSQNKV